MPDIDSLLQGLEYTDVDGRAAAAGQRKAGPIRCDSRQVRPGDVFVAVPGERHDGHGFIAQAAAAGAGLIVAMPGRGARAAAGDAPLVLVEDSRSVLGLLAARWHGEPARRLTLIGITGTNGKTSCAYLCETMLRAAGLRPGMIGTVEYRHTAQDGRPVRRPAPLTTPGPVELQALLAEMAAAGTTHVIMEVSSHALLQERVAGLAFQVAAFTNLSRDHLDYHPDMEAYFQAKALLFTRHLAPGGTAVLVEAPGAEEWAVRLAGLLEGRDEIRILRCSTAPDRGLRLDRVEHGLSGCRLVLDTAAGPLEIHSPLVGAFTPWNLACAAGIGLSLGVDPGVISRGLGMIRRVPGRLEEVRLPALQGGRPGPAARPALPRVFVDYAHTPGALENVLDTLLEQGPRRVYAVVGCGGDRDRGKRPLMGRAAAARTHGLVLTSDNPRGEDPEEILDQIQQGVEAAGMQALDQAALLAGEPGFVRLADRARAIRLAVAAAGPGDLVLVAGKGHEDYQVVGDRRLCFDDRVEAARALCAWHQANLEAATGARLSAPLATVPDRVVTDSRATGPGDVFVALAGERFDGHDFLGTAARAGAACLVVEREPQDHKAAALPRLRVPGCLRALGDLAAHRRALLDLRVVAITGSAGKTSVKELCAAMLERAWPPEHGRSRVLATQGNFNNLVGLPLSLLPADVEHRWAVLEMGMNRPGEIARLAEIAAPDIACITNVLPAHLEGLGSIDNVARAKGELFDAAAKDCVLAVNLDDTRVRALARRRPQRRIGFALTPAGRRAGAEVRAVRIRGLGARGMAFTLKMDGQARRLEIPAPGMHAVANALAAAAIGLGANISFDCIAQSLIEHRQVALRMELSRLPGGTRLVNDCYNANPGSMTAALETVAGFGGGRWVALLGDMLELGDAAPQAHEDCGRQAAELGCAQLVLVGEHARDTARGAVQGGMSAERIRVCADHGEALARLRRLMDTGRLGPEDTLLVKGSRGMRLERIVAALMDEAGTGP